MRYRLNRDRVEEMYASNQIADYVLQHFAELSDAEIAIIVSVLASDDLLDIARRLTRMGLN